MGDGYLAEIRLFAGNFAPRSWAFCSGQLLPIAQNTALFSLLGTTYGGDGRTTFGLPDLRGRVPVGSNANDAGPGLSPWVLGERGGVEYNTKSQILTGAVASGTINIKAENLPEHTHTATFTQTSGTSTTPVVEDTANTEEPTGNSLAVPNITGSNAIYNTATADAALADGKATVTGDVTVNPSGSATPTAINFNAPIVAAGSQEILNIQPSLGLNYIICLEGLFPSRS